MYLNAHTCFSLGYGTLRPHELVAAARKRGIRRLALTDINNTSAAAPFATACKEAGIEAVLGIEFRAAHNFRYVGIAKNQEGWRQLCAFLSEYSGRTGALPKIAPPLTDVFFIYRQTVKQPGEYLRNEYLGLRPEEVHRCLQTEWKHYKDRLIAFQTVVFEREEDFGLHKLFRCVDQNIILSRLRAADCAQARDRFYPLEILQKRWVIAPELLLRAEALLAQCSLELHRGPGNNRQHFTQSKGEDVQLLRKLAYSGCLQRYGQDNTRAWARLEQELQVIEKMDFAAYFLITWDIIRYAQSVGYHHVGRGSGANSIVAFSLFISDVDPLELDLYFERFINPHRLSPPDFDIDFSWDERDDVTDYVFKRYGKQHTALLATYNTFKERSIIRELGKVVGLPKSEIDRMVLHPRDRHQHPYAEKVLKMGQRLTGFPHYLSIHAGGILIGERSLHHHTALQMMPKGFPVTHFDMYTAEDLGFHKFDILSQRGLGHIKSAIDLVREQRGKAIDIHNVTAIKQDPKVQSLLKKGDCLGAFYIESPAMRGLLKKLCCDNYLHLVAASSIIRPGVAKSGMMRAYIERSHQPEAFEYIHPVFQKQLQETYGIMVYQEDVMKIVHHFAGLELDESDVLRRIMSGKKKSGDTFERLREKYFQNCRERGYSRELAEEVWRQIESFSGYSFCKAHSASFAVESLQSLYLKAHYPLEFIVGVINNFGGFYRTEIYVHEARMLGGKVHPPCINHSRQLTHLDGRNIFLGLIHVKGLEGEESRNIVSERKRAGRYQDLADFVQRVDIGKEATQKLIRVGAFRFTGKTKCALIWELQGMYTQMRSASNTPVLFDLSPPSYDLPDFEDTPLEQAFDEMELLGFPLCSPFQLIATPPTTTTADQFSDCIGKTVVISGYFVARKRVRTQHGREMNFGTWIDIKGHFFDTTHFPKALEKHPFQGMGCYELCGKVVEDFGFCSIDVISMQKLPWRSENDVTSKQFTAMTEPTPPTRSRES